jgi:hypothetical protein
MSCIGFFVGKKYFSRKAAKKTLRNAVALCAFAREIFSFEV